ncbi:PREDICTED: uncharacterized protein LOC104770417 [Camelina sativa]|uniref:Uncharacterized protein LOC104770417 n=1 Tax=Camelina sativa TaxID=90675 RepID=A0ABM0XZA5_CAMSA|nr:PREDICTED: uncharacterized protein LOC104770417 [Camelina sativa]
MAATGRSSRSVLRPLSSSQRFHNHRQRSPSPCNNLNLRLKFSSSSGNIPNKPSSSVVALSSNNHHQKRKCLCSPTTHPGSFRCAFHRRLEHERSKTLASSNRGDDTVRVSVGLNLRKLALINSLAKIGSVEAERFRRCLAANLVKPPSFHDIRRPEFRPRLSRFFELHKDQDLTRS